MLWLLSETFEHELTRRHESFLPGRLAEGKAGLVGQIFEVGPRLTFSTAYSSNAVSGCACARFCAGASGHGRAWGLWGSGESWRGDLMGPACGGVLGRRCPSAKRAGSAM
jgi:hypothetical protein